MRVQSYLRNSVVAMSVEQGLGAGDNSTKRVACHCIGSGYLGQKMDRRSCASKSLAPVGMQR